MQRSARICSNAWGLSAKNEEEYADDEAQGEVEVVRRLLHGNPDGRGEQERHAEAVQQPFFSSRDLAGVPAEQLAGLQDSADGEMDVVLQPRLLLPSSRGSPPRPTMVLFPRESLFISAPKPACKSLG